jgi:hypothetical protein
LGVALAVWVAALALKLLKDWVKRIKQAEEVTVPVILETAGWRIRADQGESKLIKALKFRNCHM